MALKWIGIIGLIFCFQPSKLLAQLTLMEALQNARTNSPVSNLKEIVALENDLKTANLQKQNYPQISIMGQATYQSDVTSIDVDFPFPGIDIPSATKDQYKIQAEVSQVLYDGGATKQLKEINGLTQKIEEAQVDIQLEQIEQQIIQIYFSILEIDARLEILNLKRQDIEANQGRVSQAVENGILLKTESYALQAAQLNLDQQEIELNSRRKTQFKILNLLMGTSLEKTFELQDPNAIDISSNSGLPTANDQLLNLQGLAIDQRQAMNKIALRPKAQAFLHGGYGRPALNFLSDQFEPYYIVGLRFRWDLNKLYTKTNDLELNELSKRKIEVQRTANHLQTDIQSNQYEVELEKINALIEKDEALFELRDKIRKIAQVQLENGALTSAEYLIKLNEQNTAALQKVLRQVQLKKTIYLFAHLNGQL